MNNIAKFKIERMVFNNDVKESLNKIAKHSGIKVECYNGFIVMFDRANIHALTPHTLMFSKNGKELIVLNYDLYHENDNLFIVDGEKYTLLTIKKYIRNYFKNDSNIKVKSNNK